MTPQSPFGKGFNWRRGIIQARDVDERVAPEAKLVKQTKR